MSNNLLWLYGYSASPGNGILLDVFERKVALPEQYLWVALGEAYKAKGDLINSIEAFRKALKKERYNLWLQMIIHELETTMGSSSDVDMSRSL
jgi:hypothetical protein